MDTPIWLLPRDASRRLQALRKRENGKRLHPKWPYNACVCGAFISPEARQCQECERAEASAYAYDGCGRNIEWGYCGCNAPRADIYGDDRIRNADGELMYDHCHCHYCDEANAAKARKWDEDDWGELFPKQERKG